MIEGNTKSGFKYSVDENIMDNWELFEEMSAGTMTGEIKAAKMMLGEEAYKSLKEHCRNEKGVVPAKKMDAEIAEIITGVSSKNS